MQNQVMDMMKQFNDNAMKTAQRMSELNMKTFETLTTKQSEVVNACFESGVKNAELVSKAKDANDLMKLQKEVVAECNTKWVSNVREAVETLTSVRDELAAIAEEAKAYTTEGTEQVVELSKKAFAENVEKTNEAVEKATAQAVEAAKEMAAFTKENTDKAVAATEEVAAKTVAASKKVAKAA